MGENGEQKGILTNLFRTELRLICTGRGIDLVDGQNYQLTDKEGKPFRFDDALESQLQRLKKQGKHELVFFDLGSGEGNLLSDLLTESPFIEKSRRFLADNPDFSIKAIGLTDAPSVADFNKEKPSNFNNKSVSDAGRLINKRIDARNYYWSLSARQKLSNFLDIRNIHKLDLVYATQSLSYFSPALFKEIMETIVSKMDSGSQMVCDSIDGGNPTGFVNYRFDKHFSSNIHTNLQQRSWKDLMRECVSQPEEGYEGIIKSLANVSHSELQKEFDEVKKFYVKREALTDEKIAELSNEWLFDEKVTDEEKFRMDIYRVLERGFANLINKKSIKQGDKKVDILNSLLGVNIKWFEPQGFVLIKK